MQDERWHDNSIQFPRLLAEIRATVEATPAQWQELADSMDLTLDDVEELFDRAQAEWRRIVDATINRVTTVQALEDDLDQLIAYCTDPSFRAECEDEAHEKTDGNVTFSEALISKIVGRIEFLTGGK